MAFAPIPARVPPDWPMRAASRAIHAPPHLWHVQVMGQGPLLLLLHGAGASTHSWRALAPLLAGQFTLVMPDLPGQGFSRQGNRQRLGLDAMAEDMAALLAGQAWVPRGIVGHSAGAALALRLTECLAVKPAGVVGINAALGNFEGLSGVLFPVLARLLALNPLVPPVFARLAGGEAQVRRLLSSTGSRIDPEGRRLYRRLVSDPAHVDGTLAMMAQWQLDGLIARLPAIAVPVLFLTGSNDRAVPPSCSRDAAARMHRARVEDFAGTGHLIHEEAAPVVAAAITAFLAGLAQPGHPGPLPPALTQPGGP
ncbi:MAG: alpha/beta fold hydrolase [Rhodobacter sp.]|nr:alpha/beta fold hydrolase [Rhodobacter sp.]MCA3515177.1 alpha/beta fold hydrolase [Rhodobacter sp.]MCA3520078.1 alpha/beta fold hydrolase [Rhodobacter sp.]MCA3522009.1 alpha/beta fold hydrolase [Rhodobacter sp.]MCA3525466.1 alpha/beta fold hydrolase [Rhodobacter sp.]